MISILGGAGFIGTNLAKNLHENKKNFSILDLNRSRNFPEMSQIIDIRKINELKSKLNGDVVVNLAAVHRDDIKDLGEYYSTNVIGAKNLCQICEEKNINKIIFTSSVAVYGDSLSSNDENGIIKPFNEYGRTKYLAEEVYRDWQKKDPDNRKLLIVRPTVVFGEGNRGNVYNLLNQINSGFFAMIGNGKNKKSMAYVKNLSAFLTHCIEFDENYSTYNYIDKPDFSMNELVISVKTNLKDNSSIGIRIPKSVGLIVGYIADILNKIGFKLPISSLRVKKFCMSSEFSSNEEKIKSFKAPYSIQEGLEKTLKSEFINPNPDRQIFFTE